jgi:DNA phosphorothioation-dependent restriction protein DptG
VDLQGRESCWGQVDYWTRTIRIYKDKLRDVEVYKTLVHEIIHCVLDLMGAKKLSSNEQFVEQLANILTDTFIRNGLLK